MTSDTRLPSSRFRFGCLLPVVAGALLLAGVARADGPRVARYHVLRGRAAWPADLAAPEHRTRWILGVPAGAAQRRLEIRPEGDRVTVVAEPLRPEAGERTARTFGDRRGGRDVTAWWLPDRGEGILRPGERRTLDLFEETAGGRDELRIELEGLGVGWAELPAGPREVVLERARVFRRAAGASAFTFEEEVMRLVGRRAGLVAETVTPASGEPEASILAGVDQGAGTLQLYYSELKPIVHQNIQYGWDRGGKCNGGPNNGQPCVENADCRTSIFDPYTCDPISVSEVTPDGFPDMGALLAADYWDFSGNDRTNSVAEVTSTVTPLDSAHTCNIGQCGFTNPATRILAKQDRDFLDPSKTDDLITTVFENEDASSAAFCGGAPCPITWQRAGALREGKSGLFGDGESRFCYDPLEGRSAVAQWVFPHQDTKGYFFQAGDSWRTDFAACEQNIFNTVCGDPGLFPTLYVKACNDKGNFQASDVLKGGVVKLPSGHTLNVLVVRILTEFCVYTCGQCTDGIFGCKTDEVRKAIYLFVAPHITTVVRLQSPNVIPLPIESQNTLEETDIKFGLLPPLTIESPGATDTTIDVRWDPGRDTSRILDYVVYWDTDSGSSSPYAFNSIDNAGQVSFDGTSATISGLTPGTTYYITVTSRSSYTDPKSGVTTIYESIIYPTQIFGDPDFAYPIEVVQTTTGGSCTPTAEVTGLTVSRLADGSLQFCWDPVSDPCLDGYDLLGSDDATSDANWQTVASVTSAETCWTGSPANTFYLVVARGTGGTGPWGHYGH
ncbi:MAG: fibronectin type III domain-containing protein [Acidobacteria bacterium]|nr:MAG: fibronectin type III domain-containing protein [Acidobacteriota bacterium]